MVEALRGDFRINAFRFKQLIIQNSSWLSTEPAYGAIGTGTYYKTYGTDAGTVTSRYIDTIYIPTDVKTAKITMNDLQVYAMSNSSITVLK